MRKLIPMAVLPLCLVSCSTIPDQSAESVAAVSPGDGNDIWGVDVFPRNGLRDDVDLFIAEQYPNSSAKQKAATAYAAVVETALKSPPDDDGLTTLKTGLEETTVCMVRMFGLIEERYARDQLRVKLLNTLERMGAYEELQSRLTGFGEQGERSDGRQSCDPDKIQQRGDH